MLARTVPACTMTAIDINPHCSARARAFCSTGGVENVTSREADRKHLPFPHHNVDLVYSHQVLVHVTELREAICEMVRMAKSRAVIVARDGDCGTEAIQPKPMSADKIHRLAACSLAKKGGIPRGDESRWSGCLRPASRATRSRGHTVRGCASLAAS